MPLIYLAGAIDKSKQAPYSWSVQLTQALVDKWRAEKGFTKSLMIYNPYAAFDGSIGPPDQRDAEKLVSLNVDTLRHADLLVVYYESDQETWGTSQEVLLAANMEIPMLVWANDEGGITFPVYLIAHMKHPFALPYASRETAAEAAVTYLLEEV